MAYRMLNAAHRRCYQIGFRKTHRVSLPVVCIGNVVVGGSGKTPFTSYCAEMLQDQGYQPVILMRGYGGKERGPMLVHRGCLPAEVGDEALLHLELLGHQVPVVIAANRAAGAEFIAQQRLGDVILLDDGYQHYRLHRDLNILLLDISSERSSDKWLSGETLPAGYLREPLKEALRRADCIVFIRKTNKGMRHVAKLPPVQLLPRTIPAATFELRPDDIRDVFTGESVAARDTSPAFTPVTAIATPGNFIEMLRSLHLPLNDAAHLYRDHHRYTAQDWQKLKKHTPLITTAKDAVKLSQFIDEPGQLYSLSLKGALLEDPGTQAFWQTVQNVLTEKSLKLGSRRR